MLDTWDVGVNVVGLDSKLQLPQQCADFYLLERLFTDTHEYVGERWRENGRLVESGTYMPRFFGSDTRAERHAYSVAVTFSGLKERLADEFMRYVACACGGELRHASRFRGNNSTVIVCAHQEHEASCCEHNCWLWECASRQPLPCGCVCYHNHTDKCETKLSGCTAAFCCGHECTEDTGCVKVIGDVYKLISAEVKSFIENSSRGDRAGGWRRWWTLAKDNLGKYMRECGEVFTHPMWLDGNGNPGGYGGPRWATAAFLCADYADGNITAQTFLDRCWSLEHNGGCIFNKFYYPNHLMSVLQVQAAGDYDNLAVHGSPFITDLWWSHRLLTGELTTAEILSKKPQKRRSHVDGLPWPNPDEGCEFCYKYYAESSYWNPCEGVGMYVYNHDCDYTSTYWNNQTQECECPECN